MFSKITLALVGVASAQDMMPTTTSISTTSISTTDMDLALELYNNGSMSNGTYGNYTYDYYNNYSNYSMGNRGEMEDFNYTLIDYDTNT